MGHDAGSNPEGCPAVRSGNSIGGPSEIWSPSGSRASGPGWRRPPLYFGVDTIQVGYIDLALIPLFSEAGKVAPISNGSACSKSVAGTRRKRSGACRASARCANSCWTCFPAAGSRGCRGAGPKRAFAAVAWTIFPLTPDFDRLKDCVILTP